MTRQVPDRLFRPGQGAEIVETHVSTIVLDGDLAHKRKKPVHFAFVDLSTPERREQMCHREVELNRRFCPDVYLGVEDVVDDAGRVVDHAVLMRRMPAVRRLATLVDEGRDVSECLRAVAHSVAAYHAGAATNERISAVATPGTLHELWQQNLDEIAPFVPDPLDPSVVAEAGRLAHRYLDGRAALLSDRIAAGRIVDGHGDLLADDIYCLSDGPRILDGLEFDDQLRWGDVLYDVGFLAMDLERLGRPDLTSAFLDWYREFSAETHPRSLEHHYVAYRALVRAKISCLKGRPEDAVEAGRYLALCRRHLETARIQLVVVGGLPGTGKTTVAAAIGERMGWPVLRSDEIRKQLAGLDLLTRAPAPYGEGLYTPAVSEATYTALLTHARSLLTHGESVVVDASFSRAGWREAAAVLATEGGADYTELCCALPPNEAMSRLRRRAASGGDASDATPSVATGMASVFEPWPGAITVSTLGPPGEVVSSVLSRLDGRRHREL
jgi:aminoglycoside phosphotransferase family enzyme/predicted kinase